MPFITCIMGGSIGGTDSIMDAFNGAFGFDYVITYRRRRR